MMNISKLLKLRMAFSAMAIMLVGLGIANAEVMQVGDLYYDLNHEKQTAVLIRNEAYTKMASIKIPAKVNDGINDYDVTGIGQQCFQSCTAMSSIILPGTLKTIGKWAFYGCSGLTDIEFPASLTNIDELAFQRCSGLVRVVLPANVEAVGKSAFINCSGLTEVVLNDNLTALSDAVFSECYKLAKVTFPSQLETMGSNVFYGCGLVTAALPESLKSIGNAVFSRCSQLTKVSIPGSVATLGDQMFYECNALETVSLGEGIETLGEATFYNNMALKNLALPQSLKSLSPSVFYGCSSITNIELPASITSIPNNCFYNCSGLLTCPLNDRITEIGKNAFKGCSSLEEVTLPENLKVLNPNTFADCSKLATVNFNDGLETIDETVFFSNTALTTVEIPASVTTITTNPFIGCANLTAINVAEGNANYTSTDGVLTDKDAKVIISYPGGKPVWVMPETIEEVAPYSFNNLPNVTDITFSPNLKKIGMSAFYNTKVKEAVFTDKLESIDNMAFFMDRELEKVVFGNTDFTTGNNCLSLTAVNSLLFPEAVTTIGIDVYGQGFSIIGSNVNLSAVWFPSTLKTLSPLGSGCSNLSKMYCWAKTPPTLVGNNQITIAPEVYVPKGTADAYSKAWSALYPNVIFKDVLPDDPILDVNNDGTCVLSWQPFTEDGYIGEIVTYILTLYNGQGEDRTVIFTHQLNANGENAYIKAEGTHPQTITTPLGYLEVGKYTVSLKGFTALGEIVMNFEDNFDVTTSGIREVVIDSDTAIDYYNLQGVRVINPEKGNVYIVRKGKNTEKILY